MSNHVLTDAIDRLAAGEDLSADEAARVLREVMEAIRLACAQADWA